MAPVLVVDDDRDIRETIRVTLEDANYTVVEAADGIAALERLRYSAEGMVELLDVNLPGMDGVEVMWQVMRDAGLTTRHVYLLVTANAFALSGAFRRVLAQLGVPVVEKPFDVDTLLDAVERAARRLEQSPELSTR